MVTVSTKAALKTAIENNQFPIQCTGEVAEVLKKKKKKFKRIRYLAGTLIVVSLVTIPITGGISAIGTGLGLTAMGLTIGGGVIAISTAELAILVGGGVAILAILKGEKVILQKDGTVTVE